MYRLSMLLVSAQLDDLTCGPICVPGTYCRLGQCIPLPPPGVTPGGFPPPNNIPPPGVPLGGIAPVGVLPGMGQFGAPCPKGTRFINNQCILTGQASQKYTSPPIAIVLLISFLCF